MFNRLPSGKQWHLFNHSHPHLNHLFTCTKEDTITAPNWERFTPLNTDIITTHTLICDEEFENKPKMSHKSIQKLLETMTNEKKRCTQVWTKTAQCYCKEPVLQWVAPEECPLVVGMVTSPASHPGFFRWSLYLRQDCPLGCTYWCTPVEAWAPHDARNVSPHQSVCCPTWRKI